MSLNPSINRQCFEVCLSLGKFFCPLVTLVADQIFIQGTSTKYSPQRVGLVHVVHHEDVIQIVKKA